MTLAHEGWLPNGGPRFAFFDTRTPGGFDYEVSDVGDPEFSGMGAMIRDASMG